VSCSAGRKAWNGLDWAGALERSTGDPLGGRFEGKLLVRGRLGADDAGMFLHPGFLDLPAQPFPIRRVGGNQIMGLGQGRAKEADPRQQKQALNLHDRIVDLVRLQGAHKWMTKL